MNKGFPAKIYTLVLVTCSQTGVEKALAIVFEHTYQVNWKMFPQFSTNLHFQILSKCRQTFASKSRHPFNHGCDGCHMPLLLPSRHGQHVQKSTCVDKYLNAPLGESLTTYFSMQRQRLHRHVHCTCGNSPYKANRHHATNNTLRRWSPSSPSLTTTSYDISFETGSPANGFLWTPANSPHWGENAGWRVVSTGFETSSLLHTALGFQKKLICVRGFFMWWLTCQDILWI